MFILQQRKNGSEIHDEWLGLEYIHASAPVLFLIISLNET